MLVLFAPFFSIISYEKYSIIVVRTTNKGLYLVKLEKNAVPMLPKPRAANIRPPLQQRAAEMEVNMDNILSNLSFILYTPSPYIII